MTERFSNPSDLEWLADVMQLLDDVDEQRFSALHVEPEQSETPLDHAVVDMTEALTPSAFPNQDCLFPPISMALTNTTPQNTVKIYDVLSQVKELIASSEHDYEDLAASEILHDLCRELVILFNYDVDSFSVFRNQIIRYNSSLSPEGQVEKALLVCLDTITRTFDEVNELSRSTESFTSAKEHQSDTDSDGEETSKTGEHDSLDRQSWGTDSLELLVAGMGDYTF